MKVSIIVPMYNSEKYIIRCLDSLVKQTYCDIEVIVIDDGSTDNSYNMAKSVEDERVRIYYKENGGVSTARNVGLLNATGDLIMFVDADDYISYQMVELLVNEVDSSDEAFIMCNNYELYDDKTEKRVILTSNEKRSVINSLNLITLIADGRAGLVCSKLISRKIIIENNIKFDERVRIGEDQLFFLQVAKYCKQARYVNKCLYYYDRRNEESATIGYQKDLLVNYLYLHKKMKETLNQVCTDQLVIQELLDNKCISMFLHCLQNEIRHKFPYQLATLYKKVKEIIIYFSSLINLNNYKPNSRLTKEIYTSLLSPNFFQTIKIIIIGYLLKIKS